MKISGKKILNRIKTYLFAAEMCVSISIVIISMFLFRSKTQTIRSVWARSQCRLLGCKFEVEGEPDAAANLVVANHQSMLDILVMLGYYPADLAFVAKKEIGDITFFGQTVKLTKMILVDRNDARSMVKMLKECKERLSEGRKIFIFPEGTRGNGDKLLAFKSGAKVMAEKLKLRIQPVVLVNTRSVMDSQNFRLGDKEPWVKIIYLPAFDVEPANEGWYERLQEQMGKAHDRALKKRFVMAEVMSA